MNSLSYTANHGITPTIDLFETISDDILTKGYSVNVSGFDMSLASSLLDSFYALPTSNFEHAGLGRSEGHRVNDFVRTDDICWITETDQATGRWIEWNKQLQTYLNRRLMLGLFSFESHFARYSKGQFYKRHVDAFHGQANRVLSLVLYLNENWRQDDGGQLVLYRNHSDTEGIKVSPTFGTLVAFLSEEFPHEVLKANKQRLSIAGWYRVNASTRHKVDPPQ